MRRILEVIIEDDADVKCPIISPYLGSDIVIFDMLLDKIYKAINDGQRLRCNFKSYDEINKYSVLLQSIIFRMIIKYKNYGIPLRIIQYKYTLWNIDDLHNINLYLKWFWSTPLLMKRWIKHSVKWEVLFLLLKHILHQNKDYCCMHSVVGLILTITSSVKYWDQPQLNFMIGNKFSEMFGNYLKFIIFQNRVNPILIYITLLNVTKIVYILYNDKVSFKSYWSKPLNISLHCKYVKTDMKKIGNVDCYRKITKYRLKLKREVNRLVYHNEHNENTCMRKIKATISKKYMIPFIKKCSNISCEIMIGLKICKGCKCVYYCSKKCQKIDWKNIHSNQCALLTLKMKQDWNRN